MQPLHRGLALILCLLFALVLYWQTSNLSANQLALLQQMPYILLALGGILALLANQARETALSINLLLAYWVIQAYLQTSIEKEPARQIFVTLSLVLPLLLMTLHALPELGLRHPLSLFGIALGPLLVLVTGRLIEWQSAWFAQQTMEFSASHFFALKLSSTAGWLYVVAFAGGLIAVATRDGSTEVSLLGCSLLLFTTFAWFHLPQLSATLFSSIGLLLLVNQVYTLLNLAYRDELTALQNRRALQRAAKSVAPIYSIAMIDIDHFKKINDTHGHDLGDQVLKIVAAILARVKSGGRAYRYGGEEFCLLFNGKSSDEVAAELETLRTDIHNYEMVIRDHNLRPRQQKAGQRKRGATRKSNRVRVSVSIGLADNLQREDNFQAVMDAADKALYRAKNGGRNQLQIAA